MVINDNFSHYFVEALNPDVPMSCGFHLEFYTDRSRTRCRSYLLIVIGTPTPETSVTVIWNSWYSRVNAWRSQGVSATE